MNPVKRIFLLLLLAQAELFAVDSSWTGANNGTWSTPGNWSPMNVPNGMNDIARFINGVTVSAPTVSLDIAATLSQIFFDLGSNYTITPVDAMADTITLASIGTDFNLTVTNSNGNGAHTIGSQMILTDELSINQTSTGTFTISGVISGGFTLGFPVLRLVGPGTLALTGANSFGGGTAFIIIDGGGTILVSADTGFGHSNNTITFQDSLVSGLSPTLQIGADFPSPSERTITLSCPTIFDTQTYNVTFNDLMGEINGAGSLTKIGSGILTLGGPNDYGGGTFLNEGTLSISSDGNLGAANTSVTIAEGSTLQITASMSSTRTITWTGGSTGTATIETVGGGTSASLLGLMSGAGSLTKIGAGSLTLAAGNNYQGGTIISAGTLVIPADSALGTSSSSLSIGAATLQTSGGITSARAISLTDAATISATGTNSFTGILSGAGSLTKSGAGTLILTGANSYSGGTTVNAGTLQGDTNGLQGAISNSGATLSFSQTFNGTYAGSLTGNGSLTKLGAGAVTFTGASNFFGTTTVSEGSLIVNGTLIPSTVTVASGATIGGTGTIGPLVNSGTISPGNSIESLTVTGTLTLSNSSILLIEIAPLATDQLIVTGTAALDGSVTLTPTTGFYGTEASYTILTSAGLGGTTFANGVTSTNPNFLPTLSYTANNAILHIRVLTPFLDFPFSNYNTRSVGENLNALSQANALSSALIDVIDSFVGLDNSSINAALDQMHPAQYSALTELHTEVGSYLASYFHRKPYSQCVDNCGSYRFWLEPFSQWLEVQPHGLEIGFGADTSGLALGWDKELTDRLSLGVGGTYQHSKLKWHPARGHSEAESYYGALYGDYANESFYWGFALLAGQDFTDSTRHIQFTTFNEDADAHFRAFDITSQLSTAYFFGSPAAYFFPYANLDFFYQKAEPFQESGANGLDLSVQSHTSKTLRTEMGLGLSVNDRNYDETICISPFASLGWAMVNPIERPDYIATFADETIEFKTKGWDHTWQLFKADFGLKFAYHCFTFGLEYHVELSPDSETTLFNQVGNASLQWKW